MEFEARDLAQRLGATLLSGGDAGGGAVDGLAIDSRLVRPGQLFAALSAERDGHDFVASAFASGAAAALVERGSGPDGPWPGPVLVVPSVRDAL
ncbi:MAG TPA: Mur ligase domain-containing protein, partial [Microthrixaceae bacterium]|nr:Mur ligase domain-containing protein [Microthrixaceae bacterium]